MTSIKLKVEIDRCLFHVISEVAGAHVSTDWLNNFYTITEYLLESISVKLHT